jgi:phospholipid/cholesterol/gamma-HCH transport system permease protein
MSYTSAIKGAGAARIQVANDNTLICTGAWTVNELVTLQQQLDALKLPAGQVVVINGRSISSMDTAGAWLVNRLRRRFEASGRRVHFDAFQTAHSALVERVGGLNLDTAGEHPDRRVQARWISVCNDLVSFLAFIGETVISILRAIVNPRRIRWKVIVAEVFEAGFKALPIVGLLSFLMGVVIAYQGAVQLKVYGANIYVADLVGFSMLRELAPLLTAILVSGRTGSAYAAQIGTMQVTAEVAALRTIGLSPMDMLVLPKLLALIIALPLLSVFADILSIFGGMVMAHLQLGIGFNAFVIRLGEAISYSTFMIGIGKAPVFAAIIAIVGCYQGFKVQGSAASVGQHTTISVVQSIFLVIVMDALFSILFSLLGV